MDYDMRGFLRLMKANKAVKIESLMVLFGRGFAEYDKSGARFWGLYPTANPFFMQEAATTGFKYITGSFWGCRNPSKYLQLARVNGGGIGNPQISTPCAMTHVYYGPGHVSSEAVQKSLCLLCLLCLHCPICVQLRLG